MTVLTREQAFGLLYAAGFPVDATFPTTTGARVPFDIVQVAVAGAESGLLVEAQGPPNSDGSVDRGWLQINSAHGYDPTLLLTDPAYCARAAFDVFARQGLNAWAAYSRGPYVKRLPPLWGGPTLSRANSATQPSELVKTVQRALGIDQDGVFGATTESALLAWKRLHWNDGNTLVDGRTWKALGCH